MVLVKINADRSVAVGQYEERCIALLWHLASCVRFNGQLSVILLHELFQVKYP